ncbi:MAG TPA: hypothetical protein PLL10_00120 [Elusimicrobiales bacterium]|nr:hypothetical protein [Elusimicrobiales bacterium]
MATELFEKHEIDRRVAVLESHCEGCATIFKRIETALDELQESVVNMKVRTARNAGAIGALVGSGVVALVGVVLWELFKARHGVMP